jgi:hypothetical protein
MLIDLLLFALGAFFGWLLSDLVYVVLSESYGNIMYAINTKIQSVFRHRQ